MKKAVIEQLLLGFILISTTIVFVATVIDDRVGRNKYSNLEDIANEAIFALAQEYFRQMNGAITGSTTSVNNAMCQSQTNFQNLLNNFDLGNELVSNNMIHYTWRDAGTYDPVSQTYDGVPDGNPDTITVTVDDYSQDTFWYKFIGKDTLNLPSFSRTADLNQFSFNVDVTFRGVIEAGYYNMVGTYELDDKGCPTHAKLILADKDKWESKVGETLAKVPMPQTRMFFIADGYRRFGDNRAPNSRISLENTSISFDNNGSSDCRTSGSFPTAVIKTDDGRIQRSDERDVTGKRLTSRANVYFQDTYLNFDDQSDHMFQIPEKNWGAFVAFMESKSDWNHEAWAYYNSISSKTERDELSKSHKYDEWETYSNSKNIDNTYDPHDNYVFVSEDLAATTNTRISSKRHDEFNSDFDFSDMSFSMKKIYVPTPIDTKDIDQHNIINLNCR